MSGQRELGMILKDTGLGLEKDQLLRMYEYSTDTKFVPLIVDVESTNKDQKYRKGFQQYLNPDDFK